MSERDDHEPAAPDPTAQASARPASRPGPAPARAANQLAAERSPYLLQHAHNPVDWYPWGEEAFARARAEDKPILLSIGYSTCHWCHVMERESFEDEALAGLLNQHFVAVKVDREERPDVDRLYMTAAQALGLGGGWPLNLFLTPALAPFHGGTYFPPEPRHGLPAFRDVLEAVARAWAEQRARIETGAGGVLEALRGPEPGGDGDGDAPPPAGELAAEAFAWLERAHDGRAGGFGRAPKFPSVANLDFLLAHASRVPEARERALALVASQLDAMQAGGIHDQLGGGFHRYATDPLWRVPHFEKMLYDQAQLAWVYLDAHVVTGRADYAATARGVLDYVARDLGAPEGGFFCAEDADSEGEEGRFYAWTPAQTAAALGDDAALFDFAHGVTAAGDFEGGSVLHRAHTVAGTARRFGLAEAEAETRLAAARARLLAARGRRTRPHRDEKVLAAWNGLMIAAFARGALVLEDAALAGRAARAAEFVWTALRDPGGPEGGLRRRWCAGEAAGAGQLADHAGYALGLVALHQATQDPLWLARAAAVTAVMAERFQDGRDGGFFESPPDDPHLRVRLKEGFDGAEIAGASLAVPVLHRLGGLLHRDDWQGRAERAIGYYRRRLSGGAWAMPRMVAALELAAAPPRRVVVAGAAGDAGVRALAREFERRFLPGDLLLVVDGTNRDELAGIVPDLPPVAAAGGRDAAYVCVGRACRAPVTEPRELGAILDEDEQS